MSEAYVKINPFNNPRNVMNEIKRNVKEAYLLIDGDIFAKVPWDEKAKEKLEEFGRITEAYIITELN